MGVSVAVTRVAANTSTGTQDITVSGFGTPKAALFLVTSGVTDATAAAHAIHSIGATDGTTQAVIGGRSEDAVSTTNTDRRGATDEVIMVIDGSGNVDGEANFDSWITDGVRINWGNAPASAYLVTVVLFGGTDLSADAGNFTSASNGGTVDVDCGFTPDIVFFFSNGTSLGDSAASDNPFNIGLATNETTIVNRAASYVSNHGEGTTRPYSWVSEQRCCVNLNPGTSAPSVSRSLSVSDFITSPVNGFEITHHNGNSTSALVSGYLALAFGGAVDFGAGTMDTPTSTGNDSQTGPGFEPQFVMLLTGTCETVNDGVDGGVQGISNFTSSAEYSISVADEDAVATSNTQSLVDDQAVNLPDQDGTTGHTATFVSMDANGWTLNFGNTLGTAKKWPWLAIETEAAAAATGFMTTNRGYWGP